MKDYYNLLGVERYCGDRNLIREKYREQIFFFHPDRSNVPYEIALLKTQELNEVWNTLSDDQAKTQYDSLLSEYYDALKDFQNFKNSQGLQNSKGFKNSQDLKNPRNFKNSQDFKNSRNFKNSQGFTNSQNYKTAQGSAPGRSTGGPTGGSARESASKSTSESTSKSASESTSKSASQTSRESTNKSASQTSRESTNKSASQTTRESTNKSTSQSTRESTNKSTSQSTRESASQSQGGNRFSFNWNHTGSPFGGSNTGFSFNRNNDRFSFTGNHNGSPFCGGNTGFPFNWRNNGSPFNWRNNGSPFTGINKSHWSLFTGINKSHGCQNRDRAIGGSIVAIVIICLICLENVDVLFSCNHVWTAATCISPATCTKCGVTEGSAAEHTWIEATCTSPRTCSVCGETDGRALRHKIIGGTFSTSRICEECGIELAALTPPDGYMFEDTSKSKASTLTIHSSAVSSYYIKLKDESNKVIMSFYVNPGADVTIKVPGEKLYVYFASGDTWYGTRKLFGESTIYSKNDGLLDFSDNTFEFTLDPVSNGNFAQTLISADDF